MGPFIELDSLALLRFLAAPTPERWRLAQPFVLANAARHGSRYDSLWPLLFATLKAQALQEACPPELLALLEARRQEALGRALLKNQFLSELGAALPSLQASVLLLKGAAFDGTLYGPAEPRLGHDLDLLTTPEMAGRIGAWLLEKGFAYLPLETGPRRRERFFAKTTSARHPLRWRSTCTARWPNPRFSSCPLPCFSLRPCRIRCTNRRACWCPPPSPPC